MPQGKYFRVGYGIIVILTIIFLASQVSFIFAPIVLIVKTLFLPFMLGGVFYYLLRPFVDFFTRRGMNKPLSILLIFLLLGGLIGFGGTRLVPVLQTQLNNLINNIPQIVKLAKDQVSALQSNAYLSDYFVQYQVDWSSKISEYADSIISNVGYALNTAMGFMSNVVVLLSTVPFILYYLLKEGHRVPQVVMHISPDRHDEEAKLILQEMDSALSSYIQGKILVSFCVGVLIYIGYLIIGIEYSLILALSAMFMNVIPFVGLFIGIIPSVVVAFIDSPSMVLKMAIVVIVAQQIESNFLSPQVMGKKMDIHPLTIILLLIVVGSFSGLLGMFMAVPAYAVVKVIVVHMYRLYVLRKKQSAAS
ncbi:AI-2E family transporter [Paenibacillus sp. N1-5-1-14]|uniref:AI-2E family transporter n=1 Tax=Paenibacillus radicibacter TaxID=2972488 RepID=UPI002158B7CD|nr:AI-2E family transporter [Paenibacillus radicibacter]MCR8645556.1 AI-2E family transporter [Paenibacillus radicibacter]